MPAGRITGECAAEDRRRGVAGGIHPRTVAARGVSRDQAIGDRGAGGLHVDTAAVVRLGAAGDRETLEHGARPFAARAGYDAGGHAGDVDDGCRGTVRAGPSPRDLCGVFRLRPVADCVTIAPFQGKPGAGRMR